jgi:hypothetical protein
VDGVRALRAGETLSKESLAAIGEALELSATDATAKQELEDLLAASKTWVDVSSLFAAPDACQSWDLRACEEARAQSMSQSGLEWAYQAAMARANVAQRRGQEEPPAAPAGATGGPTPDDRRAAVDTSPDGTGDADGQPVLAARGGDPTTFTSLLFGRQPSASGSAVTPGAPAGQAASPALVAALRTEVVHAAADALDPQAGRSRARRAATSEDAAAPGRAGVAPATTYDRGRAWQPPVIPDARRPLMQDFFSRTAEPVRP